jgi:PAS domain S-box-containing protein
VFQQNSDNDPRPPEPDRSPLARRLVLPLGGAVAAVLLRVLLEPALGGESPFITTFPAVVLVALLVGWVAGLACMMLSMAGIFFFVLGAVERPGAGDAASGVLATGVNLLLIAVAASHRAHRLRSEEAALQARAAMEAMRDSEERFRRLAELCPDAILVLQNNRVVFANPATLRLLAATDITQVIGHSPLELVHPDSRAILEQRIGRLLATGEPNPPIEQMYYRFDGELISVETTSKLVPWAGGPAVQVVARDVTERRRAEAELRESKEALEAFFEHSPVPIHWIDAQGRILGLNEAELALLGYEREACIGRPMREFCADPAAADAILARLCAGETVRQVDLEIRRSDRTMRHVLLDANALWRDGEIVHSRCFMLDVTEQRRAAEEVRAALDRFRLCAKATNDVIYDWDLVTQHLEWNEAIHALVGNGDREASQRLPWWTDHIHPEDRQRVSASLESALERGEQWTCEYRFRREDGTYASLLDRAFIVRDIRGKAVRMVGAMIDLTARRQWEEELAMRAAELEHSNAELQDFARVISHDLKEPLRGIAQYSSALLTDHREDLEGEVLDHLQTISRLSVRMHDLLDALMEYARVGRAELRCARADLNLVLRDALDSLRSRIESEHAQVVLASPLPFARCDPILMQQVFSNLLVNALKYNSSQNKRVEIGYRPAEEEGGSGTIYVRDNGIGIDPRHHDAVFQMFRRLHARDRFGGGTGSGLSIVRKIVERHGGHIWLESALERGTTFYLTLGEMHESEPLTPEFPGAQKQASRPERPAGGDSGGSAEGGCGA